MKNEFQYRLQKAIAEKGISASELSRISGVGKSDISNYINGVYIAKQDKAYLLAKALDIDPGYLMTGEEPVNRSKSGPMEYAIEEQAPSKPKTQEARIISGGIDKLPKAQREQALNVIRAMFAQYADYFKDEEGDEKDEP